MATRKIAASRRVPFTLTLAASLGLGASAAQAFQIDTGNPDLSLRWDNTLKYSAAWRLKDPSSKLSEGQTALNQNDGDHNFGKGLISNRLDILSELDIGFHNFGARLSGAAWYDTVYQDRNDNNDAASANQRSVGFDEFTSDTRQLHGGDGALTTSTGATA
jgi:hypothetical protein